jgi:hypothetical protein
VIIGRLTKKNDKYICLQLLGIDTHYFPITPKMCHVEQEPTREGFIRLFLQETGLQRVIAHLCNTCGPHFTDPITHVLYTFMTDSIAFTISEQGWCPFLCQPTLIYPFKVMTKRQYSFLQEMQLPQNRNRAGTQLLMGGARVFSYFEKAVKYYVSHTQALTALCVLTLAQPDHKKEQKMQACNIVVQRVASMTNITNATLQQVNQHLTQKTVT